MNSTKRSTTLTRTRLACPCGGKILRVFVKWTWTRDEPGKK